MLKIGIVGVGHFGKNHLKCLKESEKFQLIGFFDIDKEVCDQVQEEYKVRSFASCEEMIKEIDVLDIVTPASTHYYYASKAIAANKHVFIEKPLAQSYSEAVSLAKMQRDCPVKIQIGHIERFNPAYTAALPYLKTPMRVQVERLGTYNLRNKDVSVLEDLMIHDIDILLQAIQSPIKSIKADGEIIKSSSLDVVNVIIVFENGAIAELKGSRIAEEPHRFTRFYHSDTMVSVDYMNKKTEIYKSNGHPFINGATFKGINGHHVPTMYPEIKDVNAIKEELNTFYQSIVNNVSPPVTIEQSLMALKVCEDIKSKITA